MKALIMDQDTMGIVSMVFTQSEVLQKEVYLFEKIEKLSEKPEKSAVKQVKALFFIRPTPANIQALVKELRKPRFGKYYLYLSNTLSRSDVKILAESDEHESVCDVQEFFADFYPLNPRHFTFDVNDIEHDLSRCSKGVMAALLALNRRADVRFSTATSSPLCKRLAECIDGEMRREAALFDSATIRNSSTALLVICDRRNDPITPLLNQWTYEAMTHELLGISRGRVEMKNEEIVLSPLNDDFYRENCLNNFGEIGAAIKTLMEDFQKTAERQQRKVESIDDMKSFIDNYPHFKKMSGHVSKHVTLVSELSNIVHERKLLEQSELEQDIVCQHDHSDVLQRLRDTLRSDGISKSEATRLIALYTLRYGSSHRAEAASLLDLHRHAARAVQALVRYQSRGSSRPDDIKTTFSTAKKRFFSKLSGVENVFTQHKPAMLKSLLDKVADGKLRESEYASVGSKSSQQYDHVVVFIVGGTTYEEAAYVEWFNANNPSLCVVLGGTCVHNSASFINQVVSST